MSTQTQHMGSPNPWDHAQYFKQPLQLEEEFPYIFDPTPTPPRMPQQRQGPPSLNAPILPHRVAQYPPSVPYGTPSNPTIVTPPSMRTSFNTLKTDVPHAIDAPSSSSFSASAHISPVYNQTSPSSLEANQANYQGSPYGAGLDINHPTPTGSPNPNATLTVRPTSQSYIPAGPMQFALPQPPPQRQSELQARYFNTAYMTLAPDLAPNPKRPKPDDEYDDNQGEMADASHEAEAARPRPHGACARCKSLKVRCEFRGESDTCRRCTTAGHECVIPGRKPRRTPPKREHLLNQIREQAKQIQELMAKVEALERPDIFSQSDAQSPRSPGSTAHSPLDTNSEAVVPNAEIQDWIAKARISLQQFGGLIPAEDTTETTDDPYNDGATEDYSDDESGYATADDEVAGDVGSPASCTMKQQASARTKLDMLPADDTPYGLMAKLAIRKSAREKSVEPESTEAVGVANANFFKPSSGADVICMNSSNTGVNLPHILARGVVSLQEVDALFNIYFGKMNISTSLLDPALHTPQFVAMRSPFLFTVLCGVASRFYTPRPNLYGQLMQYAQLAAGTALISGPKNEEMSAAYLLMQLYPVPAKRWEEERSWVYLGVAIRVAQDINLNRPVTSKPLNEQNARILLSRQRIWMNCFNLDRSTGSQYGKRPVLPNTDYIAQHSEDWWKSSPYNIKGFDIHICGYNSELRLMANFMQRIYGDPNHPIGLDKGANFAQLASDTDDELRRLGERWFMRLEEFEDEKTDQWEFRTGLLKMAYAYARLVALSTGLKYAKEGQLDEHTFLSRCLDAASELVNAFVRRLFPTPERKALLRHAPDAQFVFVTFAGAFLVKLLQPKYAQYFSYERRQEIRTLVQEAVDLLGDPEVVVDDKHGPKLFSRFLGGLLASQSINPGTVSPTRSPNGRRGGSKSKSNSSKTKENGTTTHLYGYGLTPEMSSPSSFSDSSSPSQLFAHSADNSPGVSRGHSPAILDHQFGTTSVSDLFQGGPAMPIDQELLESIQFMSDPVWQDTTVPGFHWVNQLNPTTGSALHTNDYAMYMSPQFGAY